MKMKKIGRSALVLMVAFVFINASYAKAPASHASEKNEIIVSVVGGRVRSKPNLKSNILKQMAIGSVLPMIEENNRWFKVSLAREGEKEKTGWISKSIALKFDEADSDYIFKRITDKYFKRRFLTFKTAKELIEFLGSAADKSTVLDIKGDLRLKRLLALSYALEAITPSKAKSLYEEFIAKYKREIVYSEPYGQWFVRSELFWNLHNRYEKSKIGEEIAWEASINPLPGECEGYVNCYLDILLITTGKYLNLYPDGKYGRQALRDIIDMFDAMVADLNRRDWFYIMEDDESDKTGFRTRLSQLRKIILKTPYMEKSQALKQISKIAEGHT